MLLIVEFLKQKGLRYSDVYKRIGMSRQAFNYRVNQGWSMKQNGSSYTFVSPLKPDQEITKKFIKRNAC